MDYLRNYLSQIYKCLIVIFISTQSAKNAFTSYIFETKSYLFWKHFADSEKTDFGFEVETNFL